MLYDNTLASTQAPAMTPVHVTTVWPLCMLQLYAQRFASENKAVGVMKPGHSFTIEPMISEGMYALQITHSAQY